VEVGKLDTDGARAHHHEALGQLLHGHGLAVADNFLVVDGHGGQLARAGASGQNDGFGFHRFLAAVGFGHFYFAGGHHFAGAHHGFNLVLFEQEVDALAHAIGHAAAAL
nr:hypothetical protein [Tanacetum cinerariifolium]